MAEGFQVPFFFVHLIMNEREKLTAVIVWQPHQSKSVLLPFSPFHSSNRWTNVLQRS